MSLLTDTTPIQENNDSIAKPRHSRPWALVLLIGGGALLGLAARCLAGFEPGLVVLQAFVRPILAFRLKRLHRTRFQREKGPSVFWRPRLGMLPAI